MSDFESLLNTPAEEIEAPKPVPQGSYRAQIMGFDQIESSQKKTPGIAFTVRLIEAQDDVDPDALAEYKETGGDISKKEMKHTFYLTNASSFMLKEFMKDVLGIGESGRTLAAMLEETKGKEFIVKVVLKTSKSSGRFYSEIAEAIAL